MLSVYEYLARLGPGRLGSASAAFLLMAACGDAPQAQDTPPPRAAAATASVPADHAPWAAFLAEYVRPSGDGINLVDYGRAVQDGRDQLKPYLDHLQSVDVDAMGRDDQMAFWINLYNAATVDLILQEYPIASIKRLGALGQGPWKRDILTVGGRSLSLDDIEHAILRPGWKDVRIHYAVNCASIGCPNLADEPFTADRLEAMLDAAAESYVNHPRAFSNVDGDLVASSIFDWYQDDWGDEGDVLDHARRFARGEAAAALADADGIDDYDYDWSLNDTP